MPVTFGCSLPSRGAMASPENMRSLAQRAEDLSFDHVWVSDHIIIPHEVSSFYPYAADGVAPFQRDNTYFEPLAALNFLAGCTTRVKLGTHVLILPYRNPVLTAKILATLDVLSGGRLILGAGVGWMEEEFQAMGLDTYAQRGEVTDEYIQIFKELWTSDNPEFHGKHYDIGPAVFAPKPVQKPHPPILVGGETPAALRRAARLGDGWYALRHTPASAREHIARLTALREQYGRADEPFDITIGGTPSITRAEVEELEEAGVDRIVVTLWRASRDAIPALEEFAESVF